jgi:FMN phosphatase YigB (HAD superfamily)
MSRKTVDTLILDLDNTIFDWFAVWYASFEPVYNEIIHVTGLSPEEVQKDIRAVHQTRRTSEYTFLIEEVATLQAIRQKEDIRTRFHDALELSRRGRDQTLKLYPSVFRCLWDLKRKGTKIVAYTESMGFYSAYRLKRFGLDGVIDVLFSPEDHEMPAGVSVDRMRRLPDEFYELQVTEVRHTPPGELKPNPRVLLDIIQAIGARADRCAYVGDSLFKDVAMARDVGVFDIHARYGESQRRPEYGLLQNVSHWTQADVDREKAITAKGHAFEPSAVLKDTFAEIFIYCDFESFASVPEKDDAEDVKNSIDVWKKTVDVQQHFNDLEMRIRNFAITIIGVLIAAVGFTYQQGLQTTVFGYNFAAGLGLIVAAAVVWLGFFLMDRYWYHILLKGAVKHAARIEDRLKVRVPDIALGKTISEVSGSVKILGVTMNSDKRLTNFYILGFLMLAVIFVSLVFAAPIRKPLDAPVTPPVQSDQPIEKPSAQKG